MEFFLFVFMFLEVHFSTGANLKSPVCEQEGHFMLHPSNRCKYVHCTLSVQSSSRGRSRFKGVTQDCPLGTAIPLHFYDLHDPAFASRTTLCTATVPYGAPGACRVLNLLDEKPPENDHDFSGYRDRIELDNYPSPFTSHEFEDPLDISEENRQAPSHRWHNRMAEKKPEGFKSVEDMEYSNAKFFSSEERIDKIQERYKPQHQRSQKRSHFGSRKLFPHGKTWQLLPFDISGRKEPHHKDFSFREFGPSTKQLWRRLSNRQFHRTSNAVHHSNSRRRKSKPKYKSKAEFMRKEFGPDFFAHSIPSSTHFNKNYLGSDVPLKKQFSSDLFTTEYPIKKTYKSDFFSGPDSFKMNGGKHVYSTQKNKDDNKNDFPDKTLKTDSTTDLFHGNSFLDKGFPNSFMEKDYYHGFKYDYPYKQFDSKNNFDLSHNYIKNYGKKLHSNDNYFDFESPFGKSALPFQYSHRYPYEDDDDFFNNFEDPLSANGNSGKSIVSSDGKNQDLNMNKRTKGNMNNFNKFATVTIYPWKNAQYAVVHTTPTPTLHGKRNHKVTKKGSMTEKPSVLPESRNAQIEQSDGNGKTDNFQSPKFGESKQDRSFQYIETDANKEERTNEGQNMAGFNENSGNTKKLTDSRSGATASIQQRQSFHGNISAENEESYFPEHLKQPTPRRVPYSKTKYGFGTDFHEKFGSNYDSDYSLPYAYTPSYLADWYRKVIGVGNHDSKNKPKQKSNFFSEDPWSSTIQSKQNGVFENKYGQSQTESSKVKSPTIKPMPRNWPMYNNFGYNQELLLQKPKPQAKDSRPMPRDWPPMKSPTSNKKLSNTNTYQTQKQNHMAPPTDFKKTLDNFDFRNSKYQYGGNSQNFPRSGPAFLKNIKISEKANMESPYKRRKSNYSNMKYGFPRTGPMYARDGPRAGSKQLKLENLGPDSEFREPLFEQQDEDMPVNSEDFEDDRSMIHQITGKAIEVNKPRGRYKVTFHGVDKIQSQNHNQQLHQNKNPETPMAVLPNNSRGSSDSRVTDQKQDSINAENHAGEDVTTTLSTPLTTSMPRLPRDIVADIVDKAMAQEPLSDPEVESEIAETEEVEPTFFFQK